ncbi:DUF262 domain-containing protein [Entomospira culicis]|uniref:DUF262 domain-containing protein n=1 Tax=Entomospira culicis TaxID=2719989 RepID=A0A968KV43_9SPIO|nr:DUF262 domain-containing protein [Entomospira culicis]NIZ20006.1 DUF262 domain-containing protein [Entomospira culicis]NIZ70219.1 DUF262 domain-containing protein [Entomospira culicis]WDI38087.1 DUF262 domain-containing protein [Entomospira culicis]WDI39710.1 DUF262 domain-containing protein [Entomospira culicis]
MDKIDAKYASIKSIFQSIVYTIPSYQRPYRWEEGQCETLWSDLEEFFFNQDESITSIDRTYFLGNIITVDSDEKKPNNEVFEVIDGQQRLTTLTLFLYALYEHLPEHVTLKQVLFQTEPDSIDEYFGLRIESKVNGKSEFYHLHNTLFDINQPFKKVDLESLSKHIPFANPNFHQNLEFFKAKICDPENGMQYTKDELKQWVNVILSKVFLLKIHTDNQDSALNIFTTINDRGLPLDAGERFKAELYLKAEEDHQEEAFIEAWDALLEGVDEFKELSLVAIFRSHMHLLKAKQTDISDEMGLVKFFQSSAYSLKSRYWRDTMDDLQKILGTESWLLEQKQGKERDHRTTALLLSILESSKKEAPKYAIIAYLFPRMEHNKESNKVYLRKEYYRSFIDFLENLIRFTYYSLFAKKGKDSLRADIIRLLPELVSGNKNIKWNDIASECKHKDALSNDALKKILDTGISGHTLKAMAMLRTYLAYKQESTPNPKLLPSNVAKIKFDQIIPKELKPEDNESIAKRDLINMQKKIGNLLVIEESGKIPKFTRSDWFSQKRIYLDALEHKTAEIIQFLETFTEENWSKEQFLEHQKNSVSKIYNFLRNYNMSTF